MGRFKGTCDHCGYKGDGYHLEQIYAGRSEYVKLCGDCQRDAVRLLQIHMPSPEQRPSHLRECGTRYRGCAPGCPAQAYDVRVEARCPQCRMLHPKEVDCV